MLNDGFKSSDFLPCHTPYCGSFDDQGWWALAWLKAFELTHERRFLRRSNLIFRYLVNESWTGDGNATACGGGCLWSNKHDYKNAVTNELFFTLAAQLHDHAPALHADKEIPHADYLLDWAKKSWRWLRDSGMQGELGLFNDGLAKAGPNSIAHYSDFPHCVNNNDTLWTYNQGVVLSGLAKLYQHTSEPSLLVSAREIFGRVVTYLTVAPQQSFGSDELVPRVLVEPGCAINDGNGCDINQAMFKGAFVRHLGYLARCPGLPAADQALYTAFLKFNADTAWWQARDERPWTCRKHHAVALCPLDMPPLCELFANDWRGPYDVEWAEKKWRAGVMKCDTCVSSQVAALALFASHDVG